MEAQLKSRLEEKARSVIQDSNLKNAAVLLPLLNGDGEYRILFIKRSQRVGRRRKPTPEVARVRKGQIVAESWELK